LIQASGTNTAESPAWLLEYRGKSANEFIWDHRTKRLIETRVPSALSGDLLSTLGGPPDPVFVVSDRYVSTSACRPHSCREKGFLWVDTQTGTGLGAYHVEDNLILGSNDISAHAIPRPAKLALIAWLTEYGLQAGSVAFIERSGERTTLNALEFKTQERFRAPAQGPAFDCKHASSEIEKAICTDNELSAQDLALSELYNRIRQGSGTAIAQEQLRDLQRSWLKDRNRECAHAGGMITCLKEKYKAQYDRLSNWVPTTARPK
jgi:uncharacterized protein YecT (DUF1311 family)